MARKARRPLLATAKVPRSTGYQFGPDLVRQKEANYHKEPGVGPRLSKSKKTIKEKF